MRVFQWGLIGFILLAAWAAELFCDVGNPSWGLGYWLIVAAALWAVYAGFRLRSQMASKVTGAAGKELSMAVIEKRLKARSLISMAVATNGVALWGLIVRFVVHGTLAQALPFYALGMVLLLLWGSRSSTTPRST